MTLVRSFIASILHEGRISHLVNDSAASPFMQKEPMIMAQEKISTGASALAQMTLEIFDNGVRIGTTTFSPRDAWTYQANGQEEGEPSFTAKAGALTSNAWVIQVNPAPSMRQCHLSRESRPPSMINRHLITTTSTMIFI